MRTTLNIDDELYRAVKIKAVTEHRTVTELVNAALRRLLDQTSTMDTHVTPPWTAPAFPTIATKRLAPPPSQTASITELDDLVKDAELEADSVRYDAAFGH